MDALKDLKWLLLILLALWALWFFAGGSKKPTGGPFIHPPVTLDGNQ